MSKKEIDGLMAAIPEQVKAAHASVRSVNVKEQGTAADGPFAGNPIDPSDYGFDMFGCEGETYIRERSKEIARASLKVHGKPASGVSHMEYEDVGDIKRAPQPKTNETSGFDDESANKKESDLTLEQTHGRSQEEN